MADDRIARTAALFAQAWRDDTIIDAVPGDLAPRDLAEATAMQDAMAAALGEDVVGWKIAGKPGGPMGRIFASTSFENGATLPLPRYARNIMECEVGFRLKRDLPPREAPYEREEVAAAGGKPRVDVFDWIHLPDLIVDGAKRFIADHARPCRPEFGR